jgi:hypothetical protein
MENGKQQSVQPDDNFLKGTWAIVTIGPARMIARVHELDFVATEDENKEFPVSQVLKATIISFKPTCDFFSPLRPVPIMGPGGRPVMEGDGPAMRPKMGFSRDPVCTLRDFSLHPQVTNVMNGPGVTFDFLSQMDPEDRRTYQGFVKEAIAAAMRRSMPAEDGPKLVLPSADDVAAVGRKHG